MTQTKVSTGRGKRSSAPCSDGTTVYHFGDDLLLPTPNAEAVLTATHSALV